MSAEILGRTVRSQDVAEGRPRSGAEGGLDGGPGVPTLGHRGNDHHEPDHGDPGRERSPFESRVSLQLPTRVIDLDMPATVNELSSAGTSRTQIRQPPHPPATVSVRRSRPRCPPPPLITSARCSCSNAVSS